MISTLPKISIITPSYNQAQFLEATILSVLGQNYPNLEYIIMDGGSTDHSAEIIKKYEKQLFFWCSEKDSGQSNAINNGFKKSTGEILMWLNSDDILMPNILHKVAEIYLENKNFLHFGNCIHFNNTDNGLNCFGSNVIKQHQNYNLKDADYIIQPSSFWGRNIWDEIGELSETVHFGFDWEWFLKVEKKFELKPIAEVISMYRIHDDHKSGTGGRKRQEELLKIYEEFNPRFAKLYSNLMNDDLDKARNYTSFKIKLKNRLARNTSFFQKLRILYPNHYSDFSNKEISDAMGML